MEPIRTEVQARISRLQENMRNAKMDAFLVTQNVDLYYLTGSMQTGYLFVPVEGDPVYYVRRSLVRAREESAVPVAPLGSLRTFGDRLAQDFKHVLAKERPVVGLTKDTTPALIAERLMSILPQADWTDGSALIRAVRMIKSRHEIEKMKAAAAVVNKAFERSLEYIREGMPEYELAARIEFDLRMNGHLGLMRMRAFNQEIITGVIGAGESVAKPTYFDGPGGGSGLSAASPQSAGVRPIRRNEPILLDIGCCIDGYVIDQSRTLVIGSLPEDLAEAYQVAERILRNTEQQLKPGADCGKLYAAALEEAERAGLSQHFMGYGDDRVKFLGHGIGLEVDEWPVLAEGFRHPLQAGMVIAIEPKFTFPGRGIVGLENSYAVTDDGYELLTVSREGIIII